MINEELKGKITVTFKFDFDEEDDIKEGNSLRSSSQFETTVELHVKADQLATKLIKGLKKKFPSKMKQTKLEEK